MQGENTENWIRNIAKYQDGRRDMIALRRHYAGEGNSTRRIADAKRIQNTLHYKTEQALPFNKFLDSLQRMFTIFEEENEPLTERAKVDELLTKVQNSALAAAVAQLRYQLNTDGITFTVAANHLNSEISQTPDYQLSRKISAVTIGGRGREAGETVDEEEEEMDKDETGEADAVVKREPALDIVLQRNGRSYLLMSVIRFSKNATRKENKVEASEPYLN